MTDLVVCFQNMRPLLLASIPPFLLLTIYGAISNPKHRRKTCCPRQHSLDYFAITYKQGEHTGVFPEAAQTGTSPSTTALPALSLPPASTCPEGLGASIKGLGQVKRSPPEWLLEEKNANVSTHEYNINACGVTPPNGKPVNRVNL